MISGLGIDIVDNRRMKRIWSKWGATFLKRIYTDNEIEYCLSSSASPAASPKRKRSPETYLAARFAAKEAFIKACGFFVPYKDIEVTRDDNGKPSLKLHGQALEAHKIPEGAARYHLSISHERNYSVAVVIVEALYN